MMNKPEYFLLLKMLKTSCLILFILLCLRAHPANGDSDWQNRKVWIMGVPQHLFRNGIRIELDLPLSNRNKWIVVAPSLYYRENRGSWLGANRNVYSQVGAGMELFFRWYPEPGPRGGYYFSAGGGYNLIRKEYLGDRWEAFTVDGLGYYRFNNQTWFIRNHNASLKLMAGYHLVKGTHFGLDFFLGLGMRYIETTDISSGEYVYSEYLDIARSGVTFIGVAGVRTGIGW